MKYKMIVTDLDDTLLNSKGEISSLNKDAILKAQELGIKFVLASGRPTYAMINLAKELQLEKYESFFLSYNGSIIIDCKNNKPLFNESLTNKEIAELYEFSKKEKVSIITYLDSEILSEENNKYIDVEVNLTHMPLKIVNNFKDSIPTSSPKCILLEEPNFLKNIENKLKEKLGDKYSIAISKPFFLEVTKLGVDKGTSLEKLCTFLNIKMEEVIVVGDSFNDLPMLNVAGLPACVNNAKEEIKKISKYISTSNDNNGIANLINDLIF
ncbi:Cof-type HAD-IIB family hydrolase [uncultured Cetobacterium sp.]|uniref:Cof-type HAD-IIB family hydrolase n=1 Tax=uncultured Cetobacterium sp. TaxID=527638 RepID=UPI002638821F|nr:Cof-type HAD-IIB family hydrolase [uncultured Cetobacterium sp.]